MNESLSLSHSPTVCPDRHRTSNSQWNQQNSPVLGQKTRYTQRGLCKPWHQTVWRCTGVESINSWSHTEQSSPTVYRKQHKHWTTETRLPENRSRRLVNRIKVFYPSSRWTQRNRDQHKHTEHFKSCSGFTFAFLLVVREGGDVRFLQKRAVETTFRPHLGSAQKITKERLLCVLLYCDDL